MPEFNARLFGFFAASLAGAIALSAAIPAWQASHVMPSDLLKDGAGTTTGRSSRDFRILVIGELAVSMVLLMLASLMALSMRNIESYAFGYDARQLLQANVYLPFTKDTADSPARINAQIASLVRVRNDLGVAAAATLTGVSIPDWEMRSDALLAGDPPLRVETATNVSPGFFTTLGTPLLKGRDFLDGDHQQGGAVILSARAARVLFPPGDAIGHMVGAGAHPTRWMPVVGVVADFEMYFRNPNGRDQPPPVYTSTLQRRFDGWGIAIRPAHADPKLAARLSASLRDVLPPRSSSRVVSWVEDYETQIRFTAFFANLFEFIATAAMLLGAAGLFSVRSYAVGQRMREFAVRIALGASPHDLRKLVLRDALELSLAGTAIGALLSFWASTGVSSYLFGVKNTDPVSLVVAEASLLAITLAASLIPAFRASRADPVDALRAT